MHIRKFQIKDSSGADFILTLKEKGVIFKEGISGELLLPSRVKTKVVGIAKSVTTLTKMSNPEKTIKTSNVKNGNSIFYEGGKRMLSIKIRIKEEIISKKLARV